MKKKWELVDLSDYIPHTSSYYCNTYNLSWFELMRFHEDKYVWFGVGQWSCHIMDWRGCNFWHGRLPKSPAFSDPKEAIDWLYFQVENGAYKDTMELRGHHSGEATCCVYCNKKDTGTDLMYGSRETNVIVYHLHITGKTKQRKSRLQTYKENIRNF